MLFVPVTPEHPLQDRRLEEVVSHQHGEPLGAHGLFRGERRDAVFQLPGRIVGEGNRQAGGGAVLDKGADPVGLVADDDRDRLHARIRRGFDGAEEYGAAEQRLQQLRVVSGCAEAVTVPGGQDDGPPNRALLRWRHKRISQLWTRVIRVTFPARTDCTLKGEVWRPNGSVC